MDKISVIVPIYNVEDYLDECVNSLINQTYKSLEIILVDDGSSDSSGQICDSYQKKDSRINVIHKENGGLSSARNAGIDVCTGKYISFVDGDDRIYSNAYEHCISLMKKYNCDCIQYSYSVSPEDDSDDLDETVKIYEGKDILNCYLYDSTRTGSYSVWRCLFSKSLIGKVRFREGKINEDIDFKYKVLCNSARMGITDCKLYYYRQREESLSTGGLKQKDFDLYDAASELSLLTRDETYGDIAFLGEVKKNRTAFSLLSKIAYYGIEDKNLDKRSIVRKLTREHRKGMLLLLKAPLPLNRKILCILFAIDYSLAECLIKLYKICCEVI